MSSDLLSAFGAPEEKPSSHTKSQQLNPRLDPEAEDEDDDFGDFEDAQIEHEDVGLQGKATDPRATHDKPPVIPEPPIVEHRAWTQFHPLSNPGQSGLNDDWGGSSGQEVMFDADQFNKASAPTSKKLTKKQQTYAPVEHCDFGADDNWDPVDVAQVPIVPAQPSPTADTVKPHVEAPGQASKPARQNELGPPPTNIPPPSVLLFAISNIFQNLPTKIKEIAVGHRASSDSCERLDENQTLLLQKQVSIIRSSARIIAGRKFRWRRDTILSQSMKIGPAGHSGMKLSSVDKNETRREDQEVSEAIHIWKKQIGPLRSMIAKVNTSLPGEGLIIPEMAETLPVRQGKPSEGAVKAPKCCFLCGINRDERVAQVDIWVEDSFGEWWVEHWGHVDCVDFWHVQKSNLAQR